MNQITKISDDLMATFGEVFNWVDESDAVLDIPVEKGWTNRQILEHIYLTNYYLLILIRKGTARALALARKGETNFSVEMLDVGAKALSAIGIHNAFSWMRPAHMEPTGNIQPGEIKSALEYQMIECLDCLRQMPNGEGCLYKTTMTVNNLGKLDVYQYIYFLQLHMRRHLTQMQINKNALEKER